MKSTTIFTFVAIVAALGIMATASIEAGLQQASAAACNFFGSKSGGPVAKTTGNSCFQNPANVQGAVNLNSHLK